MISMAAFFIARAAGVPSAKSSSLAMSCTHSQLAERQQNSRLRRSNIAAVLPLAMLISLVIVAALADIAPGTSAARAGKEGCDGSYWNSVFEMKMRGNAENGKYLTR